MSRRWKMSFERSLRLNNEENRKRKPLSFGQVRHSLIDVYFSDMVESVSSKILFNFNPDHVAFSYK